MLKLFTLLSGFLITILVSCKSQPNQLKLTLADSVAIKSKCISESDLRFATVSYQSGKYCVYHPQFYNTNGPFIGFFDSDGNEELLLATRSSPLFRDHNFKSYKSKSKKLNNISLPFSSNNSFNVFDISKSQVVSIGQKEHTLKTYKYKLEREKQYDFPKVEHNYSKWPNITSGSPTLHDDGVIFPVLNYFQDEEVLQEVHDLQGSRLMFLDWIKSGIATTLNTPVAYEQYYSVDSTYSNSNITFYAKHKNNLYYANSLIPHVYVYSFDKDTSKILFVFDTILNPFRNTGSLNGMLCDAPEPENTNRETNSFITGFSVIPGFGLALIVTNHYKSSPTNRDLLVVDFNGNLLLQDSSFEFYRLINGHDEPGEIWCHFPASDAYSESIIYKYKLIKQ